MCPLFTVLISGLDELPLAAAVVLSRRLGLEDAFLQVAEKEIKLRKRQAKKLKEEAEDLLSKAEAEEAKS